MPQVHSKPVEILLVEDSKGDIAFTKLVFRESQVSNNIHAVDNGIDALKFVRNEPPYEKAPKPDLILLDVNMPRKNGLETLIELRADSRCRTVPVIMLSVSQAEKDIAESYLNRANCYIVKPVNLDEFVEIVKRIESFWFSIATLPQPEN